MSCLILVFCFINFYEYTLISLKFNNVYKQINYNTYTNKQAGNKT